MSLFNLALIIADNIGYFAHENSKGETKGKITLEQQQKRRNEVIGMRLRLTRRKAQTIKALIN